MVFLTNHGNCMSKQIGNKKLTTFPSSNFRSTQTFFFL